MKIPRRGLLWKVCPQFFRTGSGTGAHSLFPGAGFLPFPSAVALGDHGVNSGPDLFPRQVSGAVSRSRKKQQKG